MYTKRFKNHHVMYFAYAPPMSVHDNVNDPDRPNLPFPNAELWQRSVYYYWWLFLRESVDYWQTCEEQGKGACSELYKDFGDIRADDFIAWWVALGRDLFKEPEEDAVRVFRSWMDEHDDNRGILLNVPFTGDLERTLKEIKAILEPEFEKLRLKRGSSLALYPVASKPVLSTLHRRWRVLRLHRQSPELRKVEIFDQLKADGDVLLQNQETDSEKASFIGKSIKEAEALVKYVSLGFFPVTNERKYFELKSARESSSTKKHYDDLKHRIQKMR